MSDSLQVWAADKVFKYRQTLVRWFLYVSIAMSTSLISDLYSILNGELAGKSTAGWVLVWVIIALKCIIQGLIAWRAFIDASLSHVNAPESTR